MGTLSPLSEMKSLGRDHLGVKCNEQAAKRGENFSIFFV